MRVPAQEERETFPSLPILYVLSLPSLGGLGLGGGRLSP